MKTAVTTPREAITFDDVLRVLFDQPNGGFLRLSTTSASARVHEWFFRRSAQSPERARWCWPPYSPAASADTPSLVVQRHSDTDIRWSPWLYGSPASQSTAPATLYAACAVVPLTLTLPMKGLPPRVDPASERAALARLDAVTPPPTLAIHEGRRVTALWKLKEPLADVGRAAPMCWRLAVAVGGERATPDDVRAQTVAIPGTVCAGVFPRRVVVLTWNPEAAYSPDEL